MEQERLRAFVYDRTSNDPRGRGTANRDQNVENERFCQDQGWDIVARFTDPGKSASRHSKTRRDDYERMVDRVARGECDIIVVWESSRLSRDLEVYVKLRSLCERHRVLLCYDGAVYDMTRSTDRQRTAQDALQGEAEADRIRDRNLRTTRLNAQRGRPHGRLPYGYRRVYDEKTGDLLEQVPHEEQARVVREIATRVAAGESLYKIVKSLNGRGIPGPTGKPWTADQLPGLIVKPTYIGKRQHQGAVIGKAEWKPILEEEVYYACVRLFADPARKTTKGNAVKFLLSGIARCGECRGVLRPHLAAGKRKYTCVGCFKVSIGFAASLVADPDTDGTRAALAEAQALEAELASARELAGKWQNGRILLSALSLAKLEQQLLPQIEDARGRAQSGAVPHVLREVAGPGARERWTAMAADLVWRRGVVKAVVVPVLNPAGAGVRTVRPGRYDLEWLY